MGKKETLYFKPKVTKKNVNNNKVLLYSIKEYSSKKNFPEVINEKSNSNSKWDKF